MQEIFRARKSGSYAFDRILSVALIELQKGIEKNKTRIETEYGTDFFDCIEAFCGTSSS